MGKQTPMDKDAAARMQSAAARDPESATAQSGGDRRAQSAADRREHGEDGEGEDDDAAGLRRRGSGSPASEELLELSPWAWAFASMVGVPILMRTERPASSP